MVIRLVAHGDLLFLDFPPQLSVHPLSHRSGRRHRVVTKDLAQVVEQPGGCQEYICLLYTSSEALICLSKPRQVYAQENEGDASQDPRQEDDRKQEQPLVVFVVVFLAGKQLVRIIDIIAVSYTHLDVYKRQAPSHRENNRRLPVSGPQRVIPAALPAD